jgi:hypothetical protein
LLQLEQEKISSQKFDEVNSQYSLTNQMAKLNLGAENLESQSMSAQSSGKVMSHSKQGQPFFSKPSQQQTTS